jgi:hypothetical protein
MTVPVPDHDPRLNARASDPETSHRAAARLRPQSAKARLLEVYGVLDPNEDGMVQERWLTDEQAAELAGMELYAATKRCADLRRDGLIEKVGLQTGRSGSDRMTCRVTREGRRLLREGR